jgi:hypothetical protein
MALVVLLATAWLAGCSGSSGAASADPDQNAGNPPPPAPEDPPVDDPDDPTDPTAGPSVSLTAAEPVVPAGDSVVLSWSSANTSSCSASGGWSGSKASRGSATVGPLSQSTTFTLTCSGPGGNAVAMLSVSVLGVVTLGWQAPTENVDGSSLTDLAGYRIYYGEFSRAYTDEVPVGNAGSTEYAVTLPSGSYYFAMTAMDAEGNESGYSNEVVKIVN